MPYALANSVHQQAYTALMLTHPELKAQAAAELYQRWQQGVLRAEGLSPVRSVPQAGRPQRPQLVLPKALKQRKLGSASGRAALLHAITHIEFNAINLALDAVYRFRQLPADFYTDWLQVAAEEACHFGLLRQRLNQLGHDYGDFPAHNGLWDMALRTEDSLLRRMALVPRVFEARGLDVTPSMMQRLLAAGETATVAILEIILREEIGHVRIGNRWYHWACAQQQLEPMQAFRDLLREYMPGGLLTDFNYEARLQAGFTRAELEALEASLSL